MLRDPALWLGVGLLSFGVVAGVAHRRPRSVPPPTLEVRAVGPEPFDPLDRQLEIVVTGAAPARLAIEDAQGHRLGEVTTDTTDSVRRAVVPLRSLAPYQGQATVVVQVGARTLRAPLGAPLPTNTPTPTSIAALSAALVGGDPREALRRAGSLRGAARDDAEGALLDALAAEAAFALGRTFLASTLGARGLRVKTEPHLHARLLRTHILALVEGRLQKDAPDERAELARDLEVRSSPLERALDAALDLRLAELFDRGATTEPRTPHAARAFADLARALPEAERPLVANELCRAGAVLGEDLLHLGLTAARARSAVVDEAICEIRAGDRAVDDGKPDEGLAAYERARDRLGARFLPREQREVWYSIASARSEPQRALEAALEACRWVDALLEGESSFAAREALLANAVGYYGAAQRFAWAAGLPAQALMLGERGKARAYGGALGGLEIPNTDQALPRVQAALGPDDAAIAYAEVDNHGHDHRYLVGAVTRTTITVRETHLVQEDAEAIRALADALEKRSDVDLHPWARRLHDRLILPVRDALKGKTRWFVSPSRSLHAVPFALLEGESGPLVRTTAIARVPPFGVAPRRSDDDAARLHARRWLAVVDARHPGLPPLAGMKDVVATSGAELGALETLSGLDATPRAVTRGLARADGLLFAAHASFDPVRPLDSALLLAGGDDARLPAWALSRLPHVPAVALLLGCETARHWSGPSTFADAVIGLPRALLSGGAGHVVGSLWPVLDRDAEDFLRALTRASSGLDVVRAVAEAQRCVLDGRCAGRGAATWAAWVVDTRL